MAELNLPAAEAMAEAGASACTDVTGFGLFGHVIGMARGAGVTVRIFADALPAFPGAIEAIRDGVVPGAVERNREHVGEDISVADGVPPELVDLGFDAQTSGGLLIALPAARHEQLLAALAKRGVMAATVGEVTGESAGEIVVTLAGDVQTTDDPSTCCDSASPAPGQDSSCCEANEDAASCCSSAGDVGPTDSSTTLASKKAFGELMKAVSAGGAVDARAKELIMFSLVVMARCGACIKTHLTKAAKMGITQAELDEAAWLAVGIGGAPVWMFYQETLASVASGGSDECCSGH